MCLMKTHPNVLARDVTNSISNRPVRPFSPLCVSRPPLPSPLGPGRDRTRPCGTLCESGGWLHCVRQASRTSLVLVLRFNSQIRPALPFLFPFDLGHPCFRSFSSFSSSSHLPCLLSSFISLVLPTFPPLPPSHSSSSSHSSPLVPFHPPFVSSHLSNQSLTTTFLMCLTPRSSERGIEPVPPDFLVEDASRPAAIRNNRQDPLLHVSVKGMEHLVHTAAGH